MIGDHHQLRPKIENYMLQKEFKNGKYDLNVSLFEKCLQNNHYSMINVQYRMRPEISR